MDINKHIIDQRITKIVDDNPSWFSETTDRNKKLSKSFVLLSVSTYLGIELPEAFNLLTEGGNDAGIDALYIGDVSGDEFPVIIFQGKYKFNLEEDSNFPSNSIQKVVDTIRTIFDPTKSVIKNRELASKIAEISSLISDAKIPIIKCLFVNNGLKWNDEGDNHIKNADFPEDQILFEHYNHDDIVHKITNNKPVKATIRLSGASISEDYNFKRVIIGKISVTEIKALFDNNGDNLLQKNVRRYLGLKSKNNVNLAIKETLKNDKRENFYFYNNGITMVCSKFSYSGLQKSDWAVIVEDLQIINGGTVANYQYWYGAVNLQKIIGGLSNSKKYVASVWAKKDETAGNIIDKITFFVTDNTYKQNITVTANLTGGTTWTKYDVTFDIQAYVAAHPTADFSTAFFGIGIITTLDGSNMTNYSGVLLDDFSITEDLTSLNNTFLKGNPFVVTSKGISTNVGGKMDVYSITGAKIISQKIEAGEKVTLPTGFYLMHLTTSEGIYQQKVVM